MSDRWLAALLVLTVALAGCTEPQPPAQPPSSPPPPPAQPPPPPPPSAREDTFFHDLARFEAPGRVPAAQRGAWGGGGLALADTDNDRRLDVFVSGPEGVRLYRNTTADGPRTDVTRQVGLDACACAALGVMPGDLDNDDDADLLVLVNGAPGKVFRNDGTRFAEMQVPSLPSDATAAGWLDLDNDGLLDILALRAGGDPVALRNLNRSFEAFGEEVWPAGAGAANAAAFVDLDADSFLDVLLLTDAGFMSFRNGNGSFAPFEAFQGAQGGLTVVAGDVDNSATQDLLLAGEEGVVLLKNARGRSLRLAEDSGLPSQPAWAATFLDFDLDGFLDVIVVPQAGGLRLFLNDGTGAFAEQAADDSALATAGEFRGLALGDLDNDGRTDLLASRLDGPAIYYHNGNGQGPSPNRFFKVVPDGVQSNRDGIGARMVASGQTSLVERYVNGGASPLATSAPEVVFGLGDGGVQSLRIQWPSGTFQDQSIPEGENFDRILFASEEASRSEWGDAC